MNYVMCKYLDNVNPCQPLPPTQIEIWQIDNNRFLGLGSRSTS